MFTSEFAIRVMVDIRSAVSAKALLKLWIAVSVSAFMCSPPSQSWEHYGQPGVLMLAVKSRRGSIPVEGLRQLSTARTGYSLPPVRVPRTSQDRLRPTAPPRTTPVAHEQPLLNR